MTGLFLVVSLIWVFPGVYLAYDIPFGAAVLVHGKPVGFTPPLRRHKRAETGNSTVTCQEDEYKPRKWNYCCNKCLAGFKVSSDCPGHGQKTKCDSCEDKTFMDKPSNSKYCISCNQCLLQNGQIELSSCTRYKDVVCGCPAGQFKSKDEKFNFKCLECSKCKNGTELIKCNGANDTFCQCFLGFFFDEGSRKCRPCDECHSSDDCGNHCPQSVGIPKPEEHKVPLVALGITLAVALLCTVAYITWLHRKRISTYLQNKTCSPPSVIEGTIVQTTPLMESTAVTYASQPLPGYTPCAIDNPHVVQQSATQISTQSAPQSYTLELPDVTLQTAAPCLQSEWNHVSPGAVRSLGKKNGDKENSDRSVRAGPEVQYAIIESIPIGRWTEFVRRLGLSNYAIETSEKDHRHYKDAQYAMLGVWMDRLGSSGATRDLLFQVLRDMDLGGCVERIEECL